MKLDSFSCGCVMTPGHLKLHRLSFEFDNSSWLLGEANGWEQLDSVSQSSSTPCSRTGNPVPNLFPLHHSNANSRSDLSSHETFTYVKKRFRFCSAVLRLCVAWWAALTLLSGTFCQRMEESCAYSSLPNWKFKQTWFNTEVSCTVSTTLHQTVSRGVFQPELIKPWFCGSSPLGRTGITMSYIQMGNKHRDRKNAFSHSSSWIKGSLSLAPQS